MDNQKARKLTHLFEQTSRQSPQKAVIYTIQPRDTLSQIIQSHYKATPNTLRYRVAEASLLEFNHHVKSPNDIRAGDTIRLMPLPDLHTAGQCLAPSGYNNPKSRTAFTRHRLEPMHSDRSARIRNVMPRKKEEQDAFMLLSALEQNHGILTAAAGGGISAFGNLVGQGSDQVIRDITKIYDDYKAGKITANQYNYQHQKVVKDLSHRMGPLLSRESLRIDRRKGMVPTGKIERHASRISKLSRLATRGGVVLAGAGVAMSCRDIADTDNQQEKNEIFVETVAGTTTGVMAGYAVTLILASNPVGWGLAIILGFGVAAASFGSGKIARKVYDTQFNEYDLVNMSGIDKLCK